MQVVLIGGAFALSPVGFEDGVAKRIMDTAAFAAIAYWLGLIAILIRGRLYSFSYTDKFAVIWGYPFLCGTSLLVTGLLYYYVSSHL
jgi:hypothetical protein